MHIDASTLKRIMPRCPAPELYAPLLSEAMGEADITTVTRAAAFLAQLAWESGDLRYFEELGSGEQYEGREDLGNTNKGDGRRYKGRGPIQLTGRLAYRYAGEALGLHLEAEPALASQPEHGFRVAAWFWREGAARRLSRGAREYLGEIGSLNEVADRPDFRGVTYAVNGLANDGPPSQHLRRVEIYLRALEVLGVSARVQSP